MRRSPSGRGPQRPGRPPRGRPTRGRTQARAPPPPATSRLPRRQVSRHGTHGIRQRRRRLVVVRPRQRRQQERVTATALEERTGALVADQLGDGGTPERPQPYLMRLDQADLVAATAQFSWPPAFSSLAVSVQDLMAADNRSQTRTLPRERPRTTLTPTRQETPLRARASLPIPREGGESQCVAHRGSRWLKVMTRLSLGMHMRAHA